MNIKEEVKKITVTRRAGSDYEVVCRFFDSGESGPTALVITGQHAMELNGIEIAAQFCDTIKSELVSGRVYVIPCANPIALKSRQPHIDYELGRSYSRDNENNMNCSWPGKKDGSDAQRLTYALFNSEIIKEAEYCFDLHSWQDNKAAAALVREEDVTGCRLAEISTLPFARHNLWKPEVAERPVYPCTLRDVFVDSGRTSLSVEFSGQYYIDSEQVELGKRFLKNCFIELKMFAGELTAAEQPVIVLNDREMKEVTAPCEGLFVKSDLIKGLKIRKGEYLGYILKSDLSRVEITSPAEGYLYSHSRIAADANAVDPMKAFHPYASKGEKLAEIAV
ncbi:MAG: succinylglutamate desuccinylase/aspartoacylase family protein [Planctomycetota bacterium]